MKLEVVVQAVDALRHAGLVSNALRSLEVSVHSLTSNDAEVLLCRSAPLTSVAQMLSGLFGNADLTPSDLIAALVLCTAAQVGQLLS